MSDSARFLKDQDDLMCSSSFPQLTTEQMSQLLSSIQQSQPGLLQQVPQINSVTALPPPRKDRCLCGSNERCKHSIIGHDAAYELADTGRAL